MTVGYTATVIPQQLTNGASYDIKPTGTDEYIIHNIYIPEGKTFHLYRSDGTNTVDLGTTTTSLYNYYLHVTATPYIHVVNASGETLYISYDGIQIR